MKRILFVVALIPLACSQSANKGVEDPMPPEETAADAGAPVVAPTVLPPLERITVTLVSAEVEPKMKDGRPWDGSEPRLVPSIDQPSLKYLQAHPELQATSSTIAIPVDAPSLVGDAKRDSAPDPMVFVEIDNHIFRSPVRPRAFAPLWNYPFEFVFGFGKQHTGVVPGTLLRIHVVDFDGPARFDTMGTTVMSIDQLLAKRAHQLGPFGSVSSLTLEVRRSAIAGDEKPAAYRFAVPGKPSWTDTGLALVAGQRLVIEAADEVCTTLEGLEKCSGPRGQSVTNDKNLPGFEKHGHGALVGAIGDVRFFVGRHLEMIAPASGVLRLGVNDRHYKNNRGSYAARVTVDPLPVLGKSN